MVRKIFFVIVFTTFSLSSCHLSRIIIKGPDVNKIHTKFPSRNLYPDSAKKFEFQKSAQGNMPIDLQSAIEKYNWLIHTKDIGEEPLNEQNISFETFLEQRKTVAFLIIRKDTIIYEKYFNEYNRESVFPSFSMAKSFLSILIGCAIDDGYILSVDEPVTKYIPELAKNGFGKVTIKNLLQMTSGLDFKENYSNPFGDVAKIFYGTNLRKAVYKSKLKTEPGKEFNYNSGETQILGLVLERALNGKTITQYMQDKIWNPLGMEYAASWSTDKDKNGMEKTFCCINARTVDFAKFGRLYLNNGNWNGQQIVSQNWVEESKKIDTTDGSLWYYQYQWWVTRQKFAAEGLGGQLLFVYPANDLIFVRLGTDRSNIGWDIMCNALTLLLEKDK